MHGPQPPHLPATTSFQNFPASPGVVNQEARFSVTPVLLQVPLELSLHLPVLLPASTSPQPTLCATCTPWLSWWEGAQLVISSLATAGFGVSLSPRPILQISRLPVSTWLSWGPLPRPLGSWGCSVPPQLWGWSGVGDR